MATIIEVLRNIRYESVDTSGAVDRSVIYDLEEGDIISLTDDAIAAELISDGFATASAGPVNVIEAERGIFFTEEEEASPGATGLPADAAGVLTNDGSGGLSWQAGGAGNTSVFTDNGDGTFTHDDGTGTAVTFDSKRSVAVDNGNGTYTITDDSGNAVTITGNVAETVTSLSLPGGNILRYTDENGADTDLDLSIYVDDTNLARIVSGTLDNVSGIVTFTRDDASTFTIDMSALLPITAADAIAPAADDATGAIGSATDYAREDHKHPAQGISADAGNDLTVGSDGLHFMQETETTLAFNDLTDELEWTNEGGTQVNIDISGVVNHADATTAADDAAGDGGSATTVARSDHKHAAQGVSADAGNKILVGTDGLHHFPGSDRVHVQDSAFAWGVPGAPTATEIAGAVTERDVIAYYTGTDTDTDTPTKVFHVDASGVVTDLGSGSSATANDRIFAADGPLNPTAAGSPTEAEIAGFIGAQTDVVVYYTGTDTATDAPTHVFHVDGSGNVTTIEKPFSVTGLTDSGFIVNTSDTLATGWNTHVRLVGGNPGVTLTLPASGAIGDRLEVYNGTSESITIALDAGDTLFGNVTDFTLLPDSAFAARVVNTNEVELIGLGPEIEDSPGVNGYVILGEVMIQWFQVIVTSDDNVAYPFPTAFGGVPYNVQTQKCDESDGNNNMAVALSGLSATAVTLNPTNADSVPGDTFMVVAIGPRP